MLGKVSVTRGGATPERERGRWRVSEEPETGRVRAGDGKQRRSNDQDEEGELCFHPPRVAHDLCPTCLLLDTARAEAPPPTG